MESDHFTVESIMARKPPESSLYNFEKIGAAPKMSKTRGLRGFLRSTRNESERFERLVTKIVNRVLAAFPEQGALFDLPLYSIFSYRFSRKNKMYNI